MNTLNKSIHIRRPRSEVFAYFVDEQKMQTWHCRKADLEPAPGGNYRIEFENGDTVAGRFIEVSPDERLVYSAKYGEVDSTVTILFSDEDGGTRIRLTQEFAADDGSALEQGWDYFLGILKGNLDD